MSRLLALVVGLSLGAAACTEPAAVLRPNPPDPWVCNEDAPSMGPTPLRRLTQSQYQNSVEDVLGASGEFGSMLAEDERVGNFPTNPSVAVDRVMLEAYLDTARVVTESVDMDVLDDCDRLVESATDCASRFIQTYGQLLYRRPLDVQEEARIFGVYRQFGDTDHRAGLAMALRTMLVSPYFLYHDDYTTSGAAVGQLVPLDTFAVAARMSFFLWHSSPDAELLAAAMSGELGDVAGIETHADRMVSDPRAGRGVGEFVSAWLNIGDLDQAARDPELYPSFDPVLAEAMVTETRAFADHVVRVGDGSLNTLLTASWSIVPEELQAHYGLPAGTPTDEPVELDPSQRAGIFTHASVLAAHAHHQQSSLTLRGRLIRQQAFCQDLPDPPAGVDITVPPPVPGATTRQRFENHVGDPSCAGCHRFTDPIGFALESFDAIGHWRDFDQGLPIDDIGELTYTDVDRDIEGPVELATALSESPEVQRCVARQMFRYALGRRETEADGCTMTSLEDAMQAPDDLRALLVAIVSSDAFRHRLAGGE